MPIPLPSQRHHTTPANSTTGAWSQNRTTSSTGCYVRAGHDGTGTRRAVETIVTGLRWRAVQEPLVCRGPWQESFVGTCEELGMAVAAGLEAGVF